jgi:transcription termination factor NusB
MKNLNKFTKHELINKIQTLDNQNNSNKSILIRIVERIILFKSLLLKITLIGFIIRWIKKYSLVHKFWHIFRWIASGILGISLIDIYYIDVISWIKETNIYKWYSELVSSSKSGINSVNIPDKESEFQFPKRITEKTSENETGHTRISEWINRNNQQKEEINTDDSIIEKNHNNSKTIIIISGIVIVSALSWYYFDEIKDGYFSSIEWIKTYFSRPGSDPGENNPNSNISSTTQTSKESIQEGWRRIITRENKTDDITPIVSQKEISSQIITKDIELVDKTQPVAGSSSIDKGKGVLTSPSLESLNDKAEEAWSDSSSSTITPESSNLKTISPITTEVIANVWKLMLQENIKKDISFIEKTFASDNELNIETGDKLIKKLVNVIAEYDTHIDLLKSNHIKNWSLEEINQYKSSLYNLRKWISKYHAMINPNEQILEIGNIIDEPIKISDQFFKS